MGIDAFKEDKTKKPAPSKTRPQKGAISDQVDDMIDSMEEIEQQADDIRNPEEFILGLIAGEGSFMVNIHKSDRYSTGLDIRTAVTITLGKDDYSILAMIHHILGVGGLNKCGDSAVSWKLQSYKDSRMLADWIDGHLDESLFQYTRKYRSYKTWKKCLSIIEKGDHMTYEGALKIAKLREDMNYSSGTARTPEEIKSILDKNSQDS